MDKPKKGHTIKIKINGEEKTIHEEPRKQDSEPAIEKAPKVVKIYPDIPDPEVYLEAAAAQESVDESFDWIIPESSEDEIEVFKTASFKGPKKSSGRTSFPKKKNGRPLGPILISAAFAILIGTTIGVFMLKLVITEPNEKVLTEPKVVLNEKGDSNKKNPKHASAALTQLTTYAVQGGVYSSKEGAKENTDLLISKGIPAQLVEMSGKYYIFLGVADSLETAKTLGTQYKDLGAEGAFAKPLLLDEKKISDVSSSEKRFIESVPKIYQMLSAATSNAIVTKSISEEAFKTLTGVEEQFKTSGIKNEKVKGLKTQLNAANEKVKVFQKSKDAKVLGEAQQHLLNFLSLYYSM